MTGTGDAAVSTGPLNEVRGMNRLTSGTVSLIALLVVSGCNNDPTEDLRGRVTQDPGDTVDAECDLRGRSRRSRSARVDDQGNLIPSAYEVSAVGSGISVKRDSTFFEQFVGDIAHGATHGAYISVHRDGHGSACTHQLRRSAAGQEVTIPVVVGPPIRPTSRSPRSRRPGRMPATRRSSPPRPPHLRPGRDRHLRCRAAIVLGISEDGKTITILPPPGPRARHHHRPVRPYLPQVTAQRQHRRGADHFAHGSVAAGHRRPGDRP